MTKSKQNNSPLYVKTELIVSSTDFKEHLQQRWDVGKQMLSREIQTDSDLELLIADSNSWSDYNEEYLKQSFNNHFNEYRKAYKDSSTYWGGVFGPSDPQPERQKIIIKNQMKNLEDLMNKSNLLKSSIIKNSQIKSSALNKNEIFIVHGHDETAETKTARFIEKLGFKPIILHEQASGGKTIIEKIEQYSNVGFGIILYTACDFGGKTADDLKFRARQNVVFEHGYLMGKIGRSNVCALVKGDIELPNDMAGVVYIKMDDQEAWCFKIAKELKNVGYDVDMNKL